MQTPGQNMQLNLSLPVPPQVQEQQQGMLVVVIPFEQVNQMMLGCSPCSTQGVQQLPYNAGMPQLQMTQLQYPVMPQLQMNQLQYPGMEQVQQQLQVMPNHGWTGEAWHSWQAEPTGQLQLLEDAERGCDEQNLSETSQPRIQSAEPVTSCSSDERDDPSWMEDEESTHVSHLDRTAEYSEQDDFDCSELNKPLSSSAKRRRRRQRTLQRLEARRSKATVQCAKSKQTVNRPCTDVRPAASSTKAGAWRGSDSLSFSAEYLEQLRSQLFSDEMSVASAISAMQGSVWELANHVDGCRLIQRALELASTSCALAMAEELRGHVCEGLVSPYANYVLQKIVSHLPPHASEFVALEIIGSATKMARHKYACRIFSRLIEFSSHTTSTKEVMDEALLDASELCCHGFGHHVMQSVLEHGSRHHQQRVVDALRKDIAGHAMHRCASFLIERALAHCAPDEQCLLLQSLRVPELLAKIAVTKHGAFVAKTVLLRPDVDAEAVISKLHGHSVEESLRRFLTEG